jgi:hypothetical protein
VAVRGEHACSWCPGARPAPGVSCTCYCNSCGVHVPVTDFKRRTMAMQAHERGLNSDLLLAFLKPLLRERADLRVVIMSASMNEALFSDYFGGCPVLRVEGR